MGKKKMTAVDTTKATVHATPASIPYASPVNHAGPLSISFNRGAVVTSVRPLTSIPKKAPCIQFHIRCKPNGNQRSPVFQKATPNQTPPKNVLMNASQLEFGFPRWPEAKSKDVKTMPNSFRSE